MIRILIGSAATENSSLLDASEAKAAKLVFEVRDAGSWNGVLKVAGRMRGRGALGASSFVGFLPITKLVDGTSIAAGTGVTAAGLYSVDITGLEVRFEHTRTAGAVDVDGNIDLA